MDSDTPLEATPDTTAGGSSTNDERTARSTDSPWSGLTRRMVLAILGFVGLGLASDGSAARGSPDDRGGGRSSAAAERGGGPPDDGAGRGGPRYANWLENVDANGNALENLGGVHTTTMDDGTLLTDFAGSNLEIAEAELDLADRIALTGITMDELQGGVTDGDRVESLVGPNLGVENERLRAFTHWQRVADTLEPSDGDVESIAVGAVDAPEGEGLHVGSDEELVVSVSGSGSTPRLETDDGREIRLDGGDGTLVVEDGAGNSVEMDADAGEVSVSAESKISLNAPEIELAADAAVSVDSGGNLDIDSDGVTSLDGALVQVGGSGGAPASSVGDSVSNGTIDSGNPTVLL